MVYVSKHDIWERSQELDEKEEYALSNALMSLDYLMTIYEEEKANTSFEDWFDNREVQIAEGTSPYDESSEVISWFSDVSQASRELSYEDTNMLYDFISSIVVK